MSQCIQNILKYTMFKLQKVLWILTSISKSSIYLSHFQWISCSTMTLFAAKFLWCTQTLRSKLQYRVVKLHCSRYLRIKVLKILNWVIYHQVSPSCYSTQCLRKVTHVCCVYMLWWARIGWKYVNEFTAGLLPSNHRYSPQMTSPKSRPQPQLELAHLLMRGLKADWL